MKKLSMLFFILGSLIAMFSGAFTVKSELDFFLVSFLVIIGVFIGIFNINRSQEKTFILASGVFIICSVFFKEYLLDEGYLIPNLTPILMNLIFFIGAAAAVVSLKLIIRAASEGDFPDKPPTKKERQKASERFNDIWNMVVFVAVCLVFIIFVLQQFFEVGRYDYFIYALDFFIWVVFMVDLGILYSKAHGLKNFFKNSWLDIIAVLDILTLIPVFGILQGTNVFKFAKLARFTRISKTFSKMGKTSKLMHTGKFSKYFSKQSGFNKFLIEASDDDKPIKKKISRKRKKKR